MISVFLIAALCIAADQLTKWMAAVGLSSVAGSHVVIEGVLRFTYVENRGAAFGSLSNQRWIFLVLSTVLIAALVIYTVKARPSGWLIRTALGLLIGGGIGNMIDRLVLGYVIDFIDFYAFPNLWKWVFNGADSFVCIGAALLMIWILTSDSKEKKTTENTKGGAEDDSEK